MFKELPPCVSATHLWQNFDSNKFNEMFKFFIENQLISTNQSGFQTGGSSINQLLPTTHEIYKSFDKGFEVRLVFLDILKVFDKKVFAA